MQALNALKSGLSATATASATVAVSESDGLNLPSMEELVSVPPFPPRPAAPFFDFINCRFVPPQDEPMRERFFFFLVCLM